MHQHFTIHFIDPVSRFRAELAGVAFDLGYHAEVYADFTELVQRPLSNGIIIARDGPSGGGIASFMRRLADHGVWQPVIAFADAPTSDDIVTAIKAGVLDYLSLPLDQRRLRDTLSRLGEEAIAYGQARRAMIEARDRIGSLSNREREVLDWLSRGRSNKGIARELDISPRTVEIHRANMMHKLGARHAAEAVRVQLQAQIEPRQHAY